ncbi:MAG: alpha/beta fold hydrolase [Candidatus Sericytochromatia bacterium]
MSINKESIFIQINEEEKLHLKRFYQNKNGKIAFLLHGAIENGKIFYSNSDKGLAPFLAQNGFDVYVADLRGRGESYPKISKNSNYGQTEHITEDIKLFIEKIIEIRGLEPQFWIAHSWGGVLLASYFARFEEYRSLVKGMLFFGTKRTVKVINWQRFFYIDFIWKFFCTILTKKYGYLPAKDFKMGSDNETFEDYFASKKWVKNNNWIDPKDNFDYFEACKKVNFPPIITITGIKDKCLGHYSDVFNFLLEIDPKYPEYTTKHEFFVLNKKNGYLNDYDHINILTHKDCNIDHFPKLLKKIELLF